MRNPFPTLASLGGAFLITVSPTHADPAAEGKALVELLDLFSAGTDTATTATAGMLVNEGKSPAEVLAAIPQSPRPSRGWTSPENRNTSITQLGKYVMDHPDVFPAPLPDPAGISDHLRLGKFFEELYESVRLSAGSSEHFQKDIFLLSSLIDDAWLDVAAECGAIHLHQLVMTHRGRLPELLRNYQEAGDEVSLVQLGETLAIHSPSYGQIKSGEFQTRTLALMLAGSLGMQGFDPDENLGIILTAAGWTREHPDLIDMLRELRDPPSLALLETALLWQENREAAAKRLGTADWFSMSVQGQLAMRLVNHSTLPESDAAAIIRQMPTRLLEAWIDSSGIKPLEERNSPANRLVLSELDTRQDRRKEKP